MKRILVVDDYFEMLSFLRSMLELSNQEYRVVGVPSAEEGMLELQQKPYDLLITDLRLPGISGFDLVRRARRLYAHMPVIMITAYTSDQGQQEAADLGIFRYFRKPLDTDELLAAVHTALYGAVPLPAAATPEAKGLSPAPASDAASRLARRLALLRADTSAAQVVLTRMDGEIVHDTGGSLSQEMPRLAATIAGIMSSGYELARQLGSDEPFTMQYQAGQSVDVYSANVGADYLLSIFLGANARRGRIGTVWVFAQRAAHDLLLLLPSLTVAPPPLSVPEPPPVPSAALAAATAAPPPAVTPEPLPVVPSPPPAPAPPITAAPAPPTTDPDLDAFWEQAAQDVNERDGMRGISWEEARRQGLIGKLLDETPSGE